MKRIILICSVVSFLASLSGVWQKAHAQAEYGFKFGVTYYQPRLDIVVARPRPGVELGFTSKFWLYKPWKLLIMPEVGYQMGHNSFNTDASFLSSISGRPLPSTGTVTSLMHFLQINGLLKWTFAEDEPLGITLGPQFLYNFANTYVLSYQVGGPDDVVQEFFDGSIEGAPTWYVNLHLGIEIKMLRRTGQNFQGYAGMDFQLTDVEWANQPYLPTGGVIGIKWYLKPVK